MYLLFCSVIPIRLALFVFWLDIPCLCSVLFCFIVFGRWTGLDLLKFFAYDLFRKGGCWCFWEVK